MATHHQGQRITGVENLPTLSSEWYVPPGAQQRDGGHGEGFDPLNGRHRVRRRRRSSGGSDDNEGGQAGASDDEEVSHEDGSHYSGDSDSDSDSDSEESEDEFFEAADTDVQRKWRRLSLTSPNAPFEDTPHPGGPAGASSASSQAQRAETSAKYYAEAYLGGIPPTHADAAARSVDGHKRWWGALQRSSVLDDSAHGCDAGSDNERGAAADEPGGWSHHGDAAVTASLVPELEPFVLPSVESVFGEGPSTGPTPFGGFDLHAVGVGMRRSLDAELGLDDDEGGAPSPAPTRTSTPASSRQPSQSGAGSVSESEMGDIADVFDDAESVISDASSERVVDEERGLGGLQRKRGRDRPRASRDKFGEPDAAVVDIVPLEHLEDLRARVCSPEPEVLDTAGHQLTEQEFQDCLEDPLDNGQGGECEPVVDPFDDDDEECGGRPQDCPQVETQPQPQPQPQQAPQARRNSHSRRRRPSHGPRSPRGSITSFAQTHMPFGPPQAAVSEDEDACPPPTVALGGPQAYSYQTPLQVVHSRRISDCKASLLRHLSSSGGDVTHPGFLSSLSQLRSLASRAGMDALDHASDAARALEGMWLTLSRPNYHDCLGKNTHRAPQGGEYMYTLGRMSFDMFRPTGLVCSVQGVFNPCNRVDGRRREEVESVPRGLRREMEDGVTCLRSYNIVTAFTVEPAHDSFSAPDGANGAASRPIRGIQTTYGYVLPNPRTPNRLSVWFTGGTLECNDVERDGEEWRQIFCGEEDGVPSSAGSGSESCDSSTSSGHRGHRGGGMGGALPRRQHLGERARVLAAKLILGASIPERVEDDGTMSYRFSRPIGGHGTAYIDVLYLDDTLRILRGHHGTVYVFARVPGAAPED